MRFWCSISLVCFVVLISAQTVYKTPSGNKYYLASCRMVKNVSHQLSIANATFQGLEPCRICKPPINARLGIVGTKKKAQGVNSNNRCIGITKSGTRCKRNTRIGNDFCFQHLK